MAGWIRSSETVLRGIRLVEEKGNEKKHLLLEENSVLVHVKEEVDRVVSMKTLSNGVHNVEPPHGFALRVGIAKVCKNPEPAVI